MINGSLIKAAGGSSSSAKKQSKRMASDEGLPKDGNYAAEILKLINSMW